MRTVRISAQAAVIGVCIAWTALAAQIEVGQKDKSFAPNVVTAPVGSTVRITNDDIIVHNVLVTSPDGNVLNTGMQKVGETVDLTLDKHGDYQVRCGIHPMMKLVVHAE